MFLARVTGRVVATILCPGLEGVPLQWVQPLDERGEPDGGQKVACAAIPSGPGDLVEVVDGREAAVALPGAPFVPVDHTIVGYVEQAVAHGIDLAHETAKRVRKQRSPLMQLAEVVGTVVCPVQIPELEGRTHLMVKPVSPAGEAAGSPRIAIDTIGAGVGDRVLLVDEGNSARQVLKDPDAGLRTIIVGFVDSVQVGDQQVYHHAGTTADNTAGNIQ